MSNEINFKDAKPGMWAEFDVADAGDLDGHWVLELVKAPDVSDDPWCMTLIRLFHAIEGFDLAKSLNAIFPDGRSIGVLLSTDDGFKPADKVHDLHVYVEKPEPPTSDTDVPEGFTAIGTIKVMPGDAHDLANIPTEPGLYRAATGSIWYYDGKSWTPITDHNGEYTYAQKQSYKRFIETSLASHRLPFTPISLPDTGTHDPLDMLPTEPGWYEDNDNEFYWFDGCEWHYVALEDTTVALTNSEMRKYVPMKRIDDIDSYLKDLFGGESNGQA